MPDEIKRAILDSTTAFNTDFYVSCPVCCFEDPQLFGSMALAQQQAREHLLGNPRQCDTSYVFVMGGRALERFYTPKTRVSKGDN